MNIALQDSFLKNTYTTKAGYLSQPFEKYRKEFESTKEAKVVKKPDD